MSDRNLIIGFLLILFIQLVIVSKAEEALDLDTPYPHEIVEINTTLNPDWIEFYQGNNNE